MKIIISLFCVFIFGAANVKAQDCDIAQTGLAIFNAANTANISTITVGQNANLKFSIANFGTDPNCTIPANSATATLDFLPLSGSVPPYIYDGPATFVSGYFTWVYNSTTKVLTGINTTAIPNGTGDAGILVKVIGNITGTGVSHLVLTQGMSVPDNSGNNSSSAQLIVSAAAVNNTVICPGSHASFVAPVASGNTYQWQVDNGSGFVNITDDANYSGATSSNLILSDAPTSWYGYKYQCMIVNGATTTYTSPLTLKFSMTWIGGTSTDWENPSNWSCLTLPDANTDVIVNTANPHFPVLNSNRSCRSLNLMPGANVEAKPGVTLNITGGN